MLHSFKMRKTLRGFIRILGKVASSQQVFDIFLFFLLIVFLYGGIVIQFLQGEYIRDDLVPDKDYTSYIPLVRSMYILITFDNWPAFTKPIYGSSC